MPRPIRSMRLLSSSSDRVVELTIKELNTPGVAVSPTSLSITEGENDSYSVILTAKPTETVRVGISGATGDVSVNPTRLTFSTSNWNREQKVTVSLSEDNDAAKDPAVTLEHTVTGADEYENVEVSTVSVELQENDTRGVTVTPTSLSVAAGVSGTYRVRLNTEPISDVTVTVKSDSEDVTVTGSPLIFTTSNWRSHQTVTVNVSEDAGGDTEKNGDAESRGDGWAVRRRESRRRDRENLGGRRTGRTHQADGDRRRPARHAELACPGRRRRLHDPPLRGALPGNWWKLQWMDKRWRCECDQHYCTRPGKRVVLRIPSAGSERHWS